MANFLVLETTGQIIETRGFPGWTDDEQSRLDDLFPLRTAVFDEPYQFSKALPLIADLIRTEHGSEVAHRRPKCGTIVCCRRNFT